MSDPDILKSLHLAALSPEEQEKVLLSLGDLLSRGTLLRLVERMDEPTRDGFAKLLEKDPSPEEVEAFLKERVPGAEAAAEEALADIARDLSVGV